jgi:hypothetical protein
MALRPHAGARYRFRKSAAEAWQEGAFSNYVDEQTEAAVMAALRERLEDCEIELIDIRWKQM